MSVSLPLRNSAPLAYLPGVNTDNSGATESRWAKAMNALSLDTWGKINTKAHSSALGSSYSSTLPGCKSSPPPPESKSKDKTKAKDVPRNGQKSSEDQEESYASYWSSSSDEDEKADLPLEGLRPRPVTEDEKVERYLLFKEQLERWAESKQV